MELIEEIDSRIRGKSILKHPFYVAWKAGKLSRSDLQKYSKQYYKHVAAFPLYLSAIHSQMQDARQRKFVLQNLVDEEHGEKNHPALWMQFAEELGVSVQEVDAERASEKTRAFVENFKSFAAKSPLEGLAALYAYESQIPLVSEEKIRGLMEFYGVSSREGLEYFEVHKSADVEHSAQEAVLLEKMAQTDEEKQRALAAVDATLDAYWNMLSGIQELCGKDCGC